MCWAVRQPQ
ncbi:hypothetical protein Taro_024227 [Colocasia esculenta]|uniref:Uncharacterized protein n=1 Tax=Colocasia esculenta TaxID=4460 RepID=A0A843VAQ8_COLES|nr:hypothetical protein [Colocasia esculenta]